MCRHRLTTASAWRAPLSRQTQLHPLAGKGNKWSDAVSPCPPIRVPVIQPRQVGSSHPDACPVDCHKRSKAVDPNTAVPSSAHQSSRPGRGQCVPTPRRVGEANAGWNEGWALASEGEGRQTVDPPQATAAREDRATGTSPGRDGETHSAVSDTGCMLQIHAFSASCEQSLSLCGHCAV